MFFLLEISLTLLLISLCLAVNKMHTKIFSSGVDNKTALFQLLDQEDGERQWVHTYSQRCHTHDVYALPFLPLPPFPQSPTLVSRLNVFFLLFRFLLLCCCMRFLSCCLLFIYPLVPRAHTHTDAFEMLL